MVLITVIAGVKRPNTNPTIHVSFPSQCFQFTTHHPSLPPCSDRFTSYGLYNTKINGIIRIYINKGQFEITVISLYGVIKV